MKIRVERLKQSPLPITALFLIQKLTQHCQETGKKFIGFDIPGLPQSVNHQYIHTRFNTRLTPKATSFRTVVTSAIGRARFEWKPTGVTAAVLLFVSPHWVTKKLTVRKMDADNRVKPVFDGIERATQVPDELHWEFHAYKVLGNKERVRVFLFDLGDVLTYYQE